MFILNDAVCVRRIDIFYDIPETSGIDDIIPEKARYTVFFVFFVEIIFINTVKVTSINTDNPKGIFYHGFVCVQVVDVHFDDTPELIKIISYLPAIFKNGIFFAVIADFPVIHDIQIQLWISEL